ncbi:putative adenylate kinase [Rosa chinensis]|uniref:adenylate kinase n=1 Tax=Rosa chinensis TaxID=74649 RepID=A0A2P6P510_ROSCH|nr:probable adenylate kinase 7, mitochondrial [Rosa chinensis]PRQ17014.1 putative adenylate kinase [Rosa chinensis]
MIKLRPLISPAAATAAAPPLLRLLRLTLSRLSSSAAAAQPILDYDYYCQLHHAPPRDQAPLADAAGSVPVRGVRWAFIGSPIAKRHVYAERISKLLQIPHISMATLVRQDLHPHSSLYSQIANAVNRGEIVAEEDILLGLLSKRLEDGYWRGESGFILDGIPRSKIQAEILSQLVEIDLVVNFKCTEHCLVKHKREAAWREKLQIFAEQSKPLEDYYKKEEKLLDFQVSSAPGETWKGLLATLHLHSSL